ncbi:hypothetical protein GCM10010174_68160 [Kutzneria viridogrisea]|uniref:Glutamine--fructose-6-phosphate aminotransferase [isomerizing] n=1 Tax=Kutzneria viridogrisea TaxID=47990 RepID=A0ABR6B9G4_9PSEU|nr:glucosamine--fructose-6-phosphate aminotransferase (isomerizing) [Kutzneria viridogrisea]
MTGTAAIEEQVRRLGADVRELVPALADQFGALSGLAEADQVVLVGNGDSLHACMAAELAFTTTARLRCTARCAQRLADYPGADWITPRTLVIGISVSGSSPRVVEALAAAATLGASTLAVTGNRDSALAQAAQHLVIPVLPGLRPGPGVRTHQANLLALLVAAVHLAQARGAIDGAAARELTRELADTGRAVDHTAELVRPVCRAAAAEIAAAPVRFLLGTGPGFGTASFAAAKLVEAAGAPSFAQDVEEWWHVERFCRPTDMPIIQIAQPGPTRARAVALAQRASGIGRRVLTVTRAQDTDFAPGTVLPTATVPREEFSPLVHSVFAPLLAAAVADALGRRPFLGDLVTG